MKFNIILSTLFIACISFLVYFNSRPSHEVKDEGAKIKKAKVRIRVYPYGGYYGYPYGPYYGCYPYGGGYGPGFSFGFYVGPRRYSYYCPPGYYYRYYPRRYYYRRHHRDRKHKKKR